MSQTYDFYAARASDAAKEAKEALLDNVRERALRSEATFRGLAEQARKVAADREKLQRERREKAEREEISSLTL
ncbi:hypothetical protein [Qipengyuania soli]|uniref:Uncharacterized protein n=1 Tax=Qipengyuania soli TaxID=2782568 RepID=A0A7S8F5D5_9SPHN|nr:hypothetical protein [Qipengyuania soli]QPC99504.1 hypothetical protein IRL76_02725 [Qipengyuania soli]